MNAFLAFVMTFVFQSDDARKLQGTWIGHTIGVLDDPKEDLPDKSVFYFEGCKLSDDFEPPLGVSGYFRVFPEKKQIEWFLPADLWKVVWNYRLRGDDLILWDDVGNFHTYKRFTPQIAWETPPGTRPADMPVQPRRTQSTYPERRYADAFPALHLSSTPFETKEPELSIVPAAHLTPTPNIPQVSPCCPCPQPRLLRRWRR